MSRALAIVTVLAAVVSGVAAQAPSNDFCSGAIGLYDGINPAPPSGASGSFFSNAGATTDTAPSCTAPPQYSAYDVWFFYVAPQSGTALVRVCDPIGFQPGTIAYPTLTVYDACGGNEVGCTAMTTLCNTGSFGVPMTGGQTYFIRVASNYFYTSGGASAATGTFYLTIIPPQQPPANDLCASAIPVFDGVNPAAPAGSSGSFFDNVGAATEGSSWCVPLNPATQDVFFSYTATATGLFTVKTCSPPGLLAGEGALAVSVRASCTGPEISCGGSGGAACLIGLGGTGASVAFSATVGTSVIIRVASAGAVQGLFAHFYLTIVPPGPPPPNDQCANAIAVTAGLSGPYTNAGASAEGTPSCTAATAQVDRDVWFSYAAPATGVVTFSTVTPAGLVVQNNYATQVAVFAGCGGPELGCSSFPGTVSVPVVNGSAYVIRVASFPNYLGAVADFYLTVTNPAPPPPNDECTGAIALAPGSNGPFSTATATTSGGGQTGSVDTWYSFTTGSCPGANTVQACGVVPMTLAIHPACGAPELPSQSGSSPCGGARATIVGPANTTYFVRASVQAGTTASYVMSVMTPTTGAQPMLQFSSPFGSTSFQLDLAGFPPNGLYFLPVALSAWVAPAPNLYGLAMTAADAFTEFHIGSPFTGGYDSCGNVRIGPYFGIPTGMTLYLRVMGFATAYALPPTVLVPSIVSPPATYTIP